MPSVGALSRSPSATSQRQNRRIPASLVFTVDASLRSAISASHAWTLRRVSWSRVGSRPWATSQSRKNRTLCE